MPLYDYDCPSCGPFRDWRPMHAAQDAVTCFCCGSPASRRVAMPALRRLAAHVHAAHERNERSTERPRVVSERDWHAASEAHAHHHGHAHHDHGRGMYRPNMLGHAH